MGALIDFDAAAPSEEALVAAERVLSAGGVVVLPTDTVYGVSQAVSACPQGASGLFALKRRPAEKAIPWLVAGPEALDVYASEVRPYARALAQAFWPGGLTLVVRASVAVPAAFLGEAGTIALRVPAAPVVRALAQRLGCALATTSANTSGYPSPRSAEELEERIVAGADLTLQAPGACQGVASTIVDACGSAPHILREGAIAAADIMQVAQQA